MHSRLIMGVLATLFSMCLLWTLAVPARPPSREPAAVRVGAQTGSLRPGLATTARPTGDLVDGEWSPAGFGVRLQAPQDWSAQRSRGRATLLRDAGQPLRGGFQLVSRANLDGEDLEQRLAAHTRDLAGLPGFQLEQSGRQQLGAREVARLDYSLSGPGAQPVRAVALLWLSGPQQLVLTFSAALEHWPAVEPVCQTGLASLEFGPRSR